MPQFNFATWPGQIIWLLIVFAVLYGVLSRVFIPRVRTTLETRQGTISSDMAEARRLRDEAQAQSEGVDAQMGEARVKAQRTAAEAKAKAAVEASSRQAALEAELSGKLASAETRIRGSRDRAMGEVRGIATDTAAALTQKLSGQAASESELGRAYEAVNAVGVAAA